MNKKLIYKERVYNNLQFEYDYQKEPCVYSYFLW